MRFSSPVIATTAFSLILGILAACSDDETTGGTPFTPPTSNLDASTTPADSGSSPTGDASPTPVDSGVDTGKVLPPGLLDPIPYLSKADNPFLGVAFASYFHFEDWETNATAVPGVTPSGSGIYIVSDGLVDSIDNDDGVIDGTCRKDGGVCHSMFGGGTITFTFDAVALGALPTHVGIAWTDGSASCDAIFEAYDSANVLIGSKTATAVGNTENTGGTNEDRFFGVVAPLGVGRIVVKSSSGGVEVDHLTFGR
jgi:hypothetical protein